MSSEQIIEKELWTDNDFEQMGWHDNKIHAIAFDGDNYQLLFDIDYICKWVKKKNSFFFWVAPSTLVFRNVYQLDISTDTVELVILEISRSSPTKPNNYNHIEEQVEYQWRIETTSGEITFRSVGYRQSIRNRPVLIKRQELSLLERGEVSFATNWQ